LEILSKKILVIQTSFLGDSILSLPFLQLLKKENPGMSIHVVSTPESAEIFEASPVVDKVIPLDKKGKHRFLLSTISFAKELADEKYTKLYSLHRSFRTSILVYFTGVQETYGYDTASASFMYKHKVHYHRSYHEVRRLMGFLQNEVGDDDWRVLPEIDSRKKRSVEKEAYIQSLFTNKRIIAIAPGSVWETKKYPVEHYKEVIQYFSGRDYSIILLGGKAERSLCDDLAKNTEALNLCGVFSLIDVHFILQACSLLICNDSALAHLGVSANIPVEMVYCSTVPEFGFYPYHDKGDNVGLRELQCKPCGIHGKRVCPLKHFNCGYLLQPEVVIKKAEILLHGK
jgi:heptosyltransferase-2